MSFEELMAKWDWRPIRNCPGRYVLPGTSANLSPADILGAEPEAHEFRVERARDLVVVVALGDGGLISYKRADGSYLHTLNTAEGFRRKLSQLGIAPEK